MLIGLEKSEIEVILKALECFTSGGEINDPNFIENTEVNEIIKKIELQTEILLKNVNRY